MTCDNFQTGTNKGYYYCYQSQRITDFKYYLSSAGCVYFDIFASWFLESDKTQSTKQNLIGMFWTCRKKKYGHSNNFLVSYDPLKYVYK